MALRFARTGRAERPARRRPSFAPRLERLEDRTVPATYTWDGGPTGAGTDWLAAANWNPDPNPAGRTLTLQGDTRITVPIVNQGTLLVGAGGASIGALTTTAGSVIRQPGLATAANFRVQQPFTNNGLIDLQAGSAAPADTLTVDSNGATGLTNAPGGTINVAGGAAGSRHFDLYLDNQGTLTIG